MPFPRVLVRKGNMIVRLDFDLAYYDVPVQNISHYTLETLSFLFMKLDQKNL